MDQESEHTCAGILWKHGQARLDCRHERDVRARLNRRSALGHPLALRDNALPNRRRRARADSGSRARSSRCYALATDFQFLPGTRPFARRAPAP